MQYHHKIKSHRPTGAMCMACTRMRNDCSDLDFKHMPSVGKDRDGIVVVKCSEFVEEPKWKKPT